MRMVICQDLSDAFLPDLDGMVNRINDCAEPINELLRHLPTEFSNTQETSNCLGFVLQASLPPLLSLPNIAFYGLANGCFYKHCSRSLLFQSSSHLHLSGYLGDVMIVSMASHAIMSQFEESYIQRKPFWKRMFYLDDMT